MSDSLIFKSVNIRGNVMHKRNNIKRKGECILCLKMFNLITLSYLLVIYGIYRP